MERFQEVVKKNQTRMNDELPPVILQSFKYHDKVDVSGFTVVSSTKFQKGTGVNESNILHNITGCGVWKGYQPLTKWDA